MEIIQPESSWNLPPTDQQIQAITKLCMEKGVKEPLEERVKSRLEARNMINYLRQLPYKWDKPLKKPKFEPLAQTPENRAKLQSLNNSEFNEYYKRTNARARTQASQEILDEIINRRAAMYIDPNKKFCDYTKEELKAYYKNKTGNELPDDKILMIKEDACEAGLGTGGGVEFKKIAHTQALKRIGELEQLCEGKDKLITEMGEGNQLKSNQITYLQSKIAGGVEFAQPEGYHTPPTHYPPKFIQSREVFRHTLGPKEQSAALWDQGEDLRPRCNPALLELRNWLKTQIQDEAEANSRYNEAAVKMTHFELPTFSAAIHSMADDEATHKTILEIIVDVITEKCGE